MTSPRARQGLGLAAQIGPNAGPDDIGYAALGRP